MGAQIYNIRRQRYEKIWSLCRVHTLEVEINRHCNVRGSKEQYGKLHLITPQILEYRLFVAFIYL